MATIVRSLWSQGEANRHSLLSLETADLNDAHVSSRFIEIKKSLQDALQTDIANSGTSHAESLDAETDGLASRCAKWIYAASLSEVHPRGLTDAELAEYLLAPGQSITGMQDALKKLYDTCWYIEQTKSGRYFFHRHKNLNAQVNSYRRSAPHRSGRTNRNQTAECSSQDKRCYQKVAVLPTLDRCGARRTTLLSAPQHGCRSFGEKYKNRVCSYGGTDRHLQRQQEGGAPVGYHSGG
jgi:hypothetical protein